MSNGSNELDFEVEDLVTGKSAATSPKKRPYQKPLLVEINLSGNSQGKSPVIVTEIPVDSGPGPS